MAAAAGSPGAAYECNICLETAREPVVSVCGHLYCWPCLHQWLETRPERQECPVCKAGISRDKVIPIYGRGESNPQDPRLKTPPRPQGQRTEPEPEHRTGGGGIPGFTDTGFHMSFGIGAFPFGLFTTVFNTNDFHTAPRADTGLPLGRQLGLPNSLFLLIAAFFFLWLLSV
ncbi:E3 ubiquitin-protein ligase RNF5 [Bombina bombina]|uniref:E3 ubiquitin-protein ligase RNF5 n=1 Tax=Bombina bombina TaxID=8345 RepID=UPI00235B2136|nr:E3 ubiquitin-protein ligase RNF5 [Bombina bombina]